MAYQKNSQKQNESKSLIRQSNVDTVKQYLSKNIKQIEAALPKHMTPDRMARIALTEIRQNPKLQEANPLSFFGAIIKCSQLGLEPGFDCHLVPFKQEVQVIPGYKGLSKLVRNTGEVKSITAHVVYENDTYDVSLGCDENITHKPMLSGPRGEKLFAYAVATFKDGAKQIEPMTREEIELAREHSMPYKNYEANPNWPDGNPKDPPAWITDEAEMWRKTVIIRACKRLPQSAELKESIAMEYQAERGESQNLTDIFGEDVIDVGEDQFWYLCAEVGIQRDDPQLLEYLSEVCAHFKMEILEAQTKYAVNKATFAQFETTYRAWLSRRSGEKDTGPARKKAGQPKPPPLTIACPNEDGREIGTEKCDDCGERKGCPEWEKYDRG